MASQRGRPGIYPSLSPEIWDMILAKLDQAARKRLRLSSKEFCGIATPDLFETTYFDLDEGGLDSLISIASHHELRRQVRALVLQRRRGLTDFDDFETWESSVIYEQEHSEIEADENDDDAGKGEEDAMSKQEWLALSANERGRLYQEYEADRAAMQEQTRRLACSIYFRVLGCTGVSEPVHPERLEKEGTMRSTLERFEEAVVSLTGLKTFAHRPAFLVDDRWGLCWRRLRFSFLINTDYDEDEEIEALQLSLALRALGLANHFSRSLHSMELYVAEAAFWGAASLGRLWDWDQIVRLRGLRQLREWSSEELAEEELADLIPTTGAQRLAHLREEQFLRQLFVMEHAFVYLTDLDCEVKGEPEGVLANAARPLAEFLKRAESLERVRLVFCWMVDGAPSRAYPGLGRRASEAAGDLFGQLARCRCWPRVRELELSVVTDEDALVAFLSTLAPTLRRLTLSHVALVPAGGRWESVLTSLAGMLRLDAVKLSSLEDDGRPRGRLVLEPTAPAWPGWDRERVCYGHYESAISDFVLGRSAVLVPIGPEDFFRQHLRGCEQARTMYIQAMAAHRRSKRRERRD
ncbi:hypothetical protein H2199_009158 [Coniosporium tulheliwenetii]|uniref:Uncharacterized protein n=1 Tax=Coniosporium tulheliwenetii TaxID=3383036 RepID=A0ACC2YF27_9PEZI|nr:hypothetical protein H2199_009158 [Cladosporium sp. JES 115]